MQGEHSLKVAKPIALLKVPGGQRLGIIVPVPQYDLIGHTCGAAGLVPSQNVREGQLAHADCPVTFVKVPAAQGTGAAFPPLQYAPAVHANCVAVVALPEQ